MKPLSIPRNTGGHKRLTPKKRIYTKSGRIKHVHVEDYGSLNALKEMAELRREDYGTAC